MRYVGIDIGGTNVRVAISDSLDDVNFIKRFNTPNSHNFSDYIAKVIEFIKGFGKINGIGISITSDLNTEKTMAIDASVNAPELLNQPIVDILKKEFDCDVFMENDGTAMALGEATYGKDADDFIYIIWGTGIGGASVSRKNSHIVVNQIDWYKYFEKWEYDCGGQAISNFYKKSAKEITTKEWTDIMKNFEKHLLKFCETYKTNLIIFGGGVALNKFDLVLKLKEEIKDKIPEVSLTKFGDDTGLYGTFALIKLNTQKEV